ncbi:MAG: prepilin-type N-terminal cleavage/methylation domain-containing protein, partial [Planctomycetes bacterium]|nr:prepilin-type N-terminal cleavage/methylation domain-containing protein [Planctomycetota bacterium]
MDRELRRLGLGESGARPCGAIPDRRDTGLTLIELVVVLGIVATLLGISSAIYQRVRQANALPAAASQVSSVVRAARNYALTSSLPSKVFVQPQKAESDAPGKITAFGFELVAAFHFEDLRPGEGERVGAIPRGTRVEGALNEFGTVQGECYPVRGKVGTAIDFVNEGASIVSEHRPRYNSSVGFSLEAWVQFYPPELTDRERAIVEKNRNGVWEDPRRDSR